MTRRAVGARPGREEGTGGLAAGGSAEWRARAVVMGTLIPEATVPVTVELCSICTLPPWLHFLE